ncbi:tripartite tricarboxylate transporter substrate binding protein BugD [Roseomonas terrae]|uniref:Tripartite tricarboxylate transporter substrate binding protein BugD n=1 Tax=Neoroseomonas terrae TaxID=424799 RepID=A0ABS5EKU4_9PROT|nr:tripartite tricarboxylate transporter substrate-binding protein [Neoroseomonas terrae]MBR0651644.1 tripartite tricarboxylate transporter substrate binding protein BugD [Neoroseomonas terrae]
MTSRRHLLTGLAAGLALPGLARAQGFPTRPITIVASGAAGGPTDTITRIVAEAMGPHLSQPLVVESISGSTVAPLRVANARPDGYTLLVNNIGMAASATLFRRLPYDVLTSFAPIGIVSDAAMTVISRPDFPAADLADLVNVLRQQGDRINLAGSGLSSASNLCGLLVQHAAEAKATVIGFRGSAPAITELMAGRIDIFCDQATNTIPYIRENRIRVWGVTGERRLQGLPNVPTAAEAGFPGIAMSTWHGMYAPAGTPEEIQLQISAALRAALKDDRLRQRFAELLTDPATEERATVAFHRRFLAEEVARWRPIIEAAGAYAD